MILGVEWLAKLGEITLNSGELIIWGDPTLERRVVELESLLKMSEVETWESREQEQEDKGERKLMEEQKEEMGRVLEQYEGCFRKP